MSNEKSSGTTQSKAIELIEDELDSVVGGVDLNSVKEITSKEPDERVNYAFDGKSDGTKRLRDGFVKSGFTTEEIKPKG
ncbi:MAG: hypothetical protein AB8B79_23340 [Granulosicoccus sp.]